MFQNDITNSQNKYFKYPIKVALAVVCKGRCVCVYLTADDGGISWFREEMDKKISKLDEPIRCGSMTHVLEREYLIYKRDRVIAYTEVKHETINIMAAIAYETVMCDFKKVYHDEIDRSVRNAEEALMSRGEYKRIDFRSLVMKVCRYCFETFCNEDGSIRQSDS